MAGLNQRTTLTYEQMVEYVARVTDPIEEHLTSHDKWHLERLSAEQQARQALMIAAASMVITVILAVMGLVLQFLGHH